MAAPLLLAAAGAAAAGYASIADWVAANTSKVVAWYPLDDATASGTANDANGSLDGTYGSAVSSTTIDGIAACDFSAVSALNGGVTRADNAAWDNVFAVFCVARFDSTNDGAGEDTLVCRRSFPESNGAWVFDRTTGNKLRFFNYNGGGYPVRTGTTTLSGSTTYTLGAAFIPTTIHLYVNGANDSATGSSGTFEVGSSGIGIGAHVTNGAGVTGNANIEGKMAHVLLLTDASDAIMLELHNAWIAEST